VGGGMSYIAGGYDSTEKAAGLTENYI